MKCEHEGCEEEVAPPVHYEATWSVVEMPRLCRAHLAAWLREKADEVEGVRECHVCHGAGGWVRGNIIDGYQWFPCTDLCSNGKVPR